ncbi:hypothetical protein BDDG_13265, partial [Blastomyces dermatitidis ATCC 18188]
TPVSETILIEDDNTAEIILFYSQASSVTFSSFSAEKVVHISDYKCSALSDFCCHLSNSASSSFSVSSISALSVLASDSVSLALFFNFSIYMHVHFYIGISVNIVINDINVVCRVVEESEICT